MYSLSCRVFPCCIFKIHHVFHVPTVVLVDVSGPVHRKVNAGFVGFQNEVFKLLAAAFEAQLFIGRDIKVFLIVMGMSVRSTPTGCLVLES